jgi:excisionase family DNA binding protein
MTMLTTEQAADRLGVTPARVRVLIREGRLPAQSFGRAHMINENDLKLVEERKPGRPRKAQSGGTSRPASKRK